MRIFSFAVIALTIGQLAPVFAETDPNQCSQQPLADGGTVCDYNLGVAIINCENAADTLIHSQRIFEGSECSAYGDQINAATASYLSLSQASGTSPLHTLGHDYLVSRLAFCQRTSAAATQLISEMKASGCNPVPPGVDTSNGQYVATGNAGGVSGGMSGGYSGGVSSGASGQNPMPTGGTPLGGGGYMGSDGSVVSSVGGGSYESGGNVYTPTGGGNYVGSNGTSYTAVGSGQYVDSSGNMYVPSGGSGYTYTGGNDGGNPNTYR